MLPKVCGTSNMPETPQASDGAGRGTVGRTLFVGERGKAEGQARGQLVRKHDWENAQTSSDRRAQPVSSSGLRPGNSGGALSPCLCSKQKKQRPAMPR